MCRVSDGFQWRSKQKQETDRTDDTDSDKTFISSDATNTVPLIFADPCDPSNPSRVLVSDGGFCELGWIGVLACMGVDFLAQVFPNRFGHSQKYFNNFGIELSSG